MSIVASKIVELSHRYSSMTDLHLRPERPLMVRTLRGFEPLDDELISHRDIEEFLALPALGGPIWRKRLVVGGGKLEITHTMTKARVRISIYEEGGMQRHIACTVRMVPLIPPSLQQLGVPALVADMTGRNKGLILITGRAGAGKTTTLAALVNWINHARSTHIATVEQPIEYVIKNGKSIVSQREVSSNIKSFGAGVREALRQRADVIVVGEVSDKETVDAMLHAADSGRLVLAALPTRNCEDTVNRLLSYYEGLELRRKSDLLAANLVGVMSQALVPAADGNCVYLASELMVNNLATAHAIRENKTRLLPGFIRAGRARGMRLLNQDLAQLILNGKISLKDAAAAASASALR